LANRKVQIIKDTGSPHWNAGDTPQDPDGNRLLTDAAGPAVDEMKGATLVASGTALGGSVVTLEVFAGDRFYLTSGYCISLVTPSPGNQGWVQILAIRSLKVDGGNTTYQLATQAGGFTGSVTGANIAYKVYRVDET
jgi:hypothetical protein